MNYLIAVLPDRIKAEAAYSALENESLPMEQVSLIGKGYKDFSEFSFLDPKAQARQQARWMSYWLIPFGFIAGYIFNVQTQYGLVPAVGALGNHVVGGLLGAVAGAMGSFFIGGGSAILTPGNNDTFPYPSYLKAGKYLVVVSGAPNVINKANRLLKPFSIEKIQNYVDPNRN